MEPLVGLDLKNFQSFTDTQLNLAPGLNVLVGPSNLGKSAAIRALKAMVYNAPATGLVRDGAKQFETKAWFADGQKIELVKGKSKSEFYWNDDVYAKSGATEVPSIIKERWNVATPDGRKLCFASQHEPPFLLAEPASAVAKVLGDLTNANMLMEAVGQANRQRQAATNDAKARTREAEETRDEIMTHTGLTARGKALEAARKAYNVAEDAQSYHDELVQFYTTFIINKRERAELAQLNERSVSFDTLIADVDSALANWTALQDIDEERRRLLAEQALERRRALFLQEDIDATEQKITTLLEEAGVCPLCNQVVEH